MLFQSGHPTTDVDWLVEKIRWAIEGFDSFKSAGEDGIFSALLEKWN
jgi:hypothetical protein